MAGGVTAFVANTNEYTPKFEGIESLNLQIWDDLALCKGLRITPNELDSSVMRGDYLHTKLANIATYYGGLTVATTDTLDICEDNCNCLTGIKGRI